MVVAPTRTKVRLVYGLLAVGIAGSIYGAVLLRGWLPFETPRVQDGFTQSPEDEFELREAFARLDHVASRKAVVDFRPIDPELDRHDAVMTPNEFYQRMMVMDAGRQILNAEGKCAVHFGGDPARCSAIQDETRQLYSLPSPDEDWARDYCSRFGVQYLTLSHRDPDWASASGWPVTLPVIVAEPGFKIFQCGPDNFKR